MEQRKVKILALSVKEDKEIHRWTSYTRIKVSFIHWPAQTLPFRCSVVLNKVSVVVPTNFPGVLSVLSNSWFLEAESVNERRLQKEVQKAVAGDISSWPWLTRESLC